MKTKRFLRFFGIVLLVIVGLTACVRSRTPSVVVTPTSAVPGSVTTPGTNDVMDQLELFVTQTALAAQGQTPQQETPVPTTEPQVPEATPQAETPQAEVPTNTSPPAQPTATLVPVPTATPGLPNNYTLQGGEFPFCIARRFDVDPGELLSLNGLSPTSTFYSGMTLKIPQTGNSFPGDRSLRSHPTTHTVSGDETIYSIACQYGDVDPNSIAIANNLSSPYRLNAGQEIRIP
jgi:LysM repeat protein